MSTSAKKPQLKKIDCKLRLQSLLREGLIKNEQEIPTDAWPASIEVARQGVFTKILYYIDKPFVCKDCGQKEVWTKEDQRFWYETLHRTIYSQAARCSACRAKQRQIKEDQRRRMAASKLVNLKV
jgi:Probable zinc-ribbon domain